MAAALRSNTSRKTASLTLSHFQYFILNRLHAATPTTTVTRSLLSSLREERGVTLRIEVRRR
ncbi:hypothetical protein Bca4012_036890 [Brassica carinata]